MPAHREICGFLYKSFDDLVREESPKLLQLIGEIDRSDNNSLEDFFNKFTEKNNRHTFEDLVDLSQYFAVKQLLSSVADSAAHIKQTPSDNPFLRSVPLLGSTIADALDQLSKVFCCKTVFTGHPTEFASDETIRMTKDLIDLIIEHDKLETISKKSLNNRLIKLFHSHLSPKTKLSAEEEVVRNLKHLEYVYHYLPQLRIDLHNAFTQTFGKEFDAATKKKLDNLLQTSIEFRSWTGGDADGNFRVISDKMARAVNLHKHNAAKVHLNELHRIMKGTSDLHLKNHLESLEPILKDLNIDRAIQILEDLKQEESATEIENFIFLLKVFGKNMASIDVRQNSQVLGSVVSSILSGMRFYLEDKAHLSKEESEILVLLKKSPYEKYRCKDEFANERITILNNILQNPNLVDTASNLLVSGWFKDKYVIVSEELSRLQFITVFPNIFQNYIISNCEGVDCILELVFLCKICSAKPNIIPLFESLSAIESSTIIISNLLENQVYKDFLKDRNQKVMIGYSDSQKENGVCILPEIAQKMQALTELDKRIEFFHGNGLDLGRGGPNIIQSEQTFQGRHIRYTFMHYFEARTYYNSLITRALEPIVDKKDINLKKFTTKGAEFFSKLRSDESTRRHFSNYLNIASPFDLFVRTNNFSSRPSQRNLDDSSSTPYSIWFRDLILDTSDILNGLRAIPWILTLEGTNTFLDLWYGFLAGAKDINPSELKDLYHSIPSFKDTVDKVIIGLSFADFDMAWSYFPKDLRNLDKREYKPEDMRISGAYFLKTIHSDFIATSDFVQKALFPHNVELLEIIKTRKEESIFIRSLIAWLNLQLTFNKRKAPELFLDSNEADFQKMCGALYLGFTEYRTIPKLYLS